MAQIVLLRELMVVFYGNEVSIGLMLASWLAWTATGSSIFPTLAGRFGGLREPRHLMAGLETLLALVLPGTVLAVRSARMALGAVPGEVLGPGFMLLTSLGALSLFCMLSGALFPAGSSLYAREAGVSAGDATGSVYLLEAVGSSLGGLVAGLLLVPILGSMEIAVLLATVNLFAAASLTVAYRRLSLATAVAAIAVLALALATAPRLEKLSEERLWNGFRLIATRNSVYGNLAVVQEEGSRSVYENGVVLFHVPDPAAAEEAVHYALLEHPAPRRLLLIGGGLNGSIAQALQHPSLEQVDYAELDPAILDVARKYFPDEWAAAKNNPRVRVHTNDGRLFLKSADCEFDVIIVNLPDPQTAELNRFYTVEFFREAARKLTPTGILSFHVTAAEDYVSPELAEFLRSIATSLSAVFPEVRAIPGGTFHFFAARRPGVLAGGAEELLARLRERHLNTSYVREYYLPFRMSRDRMAELESQIRPGPDAAINHDFAPIAYYFDAALWSSRFHQGYARLFRTMAEVSFRGLALTAGLVLAVIAAAGRLLKGRERRCRATAAACTISMGFLSIGLEMLLLLAFQAIYGYVYQQLAIVIAVFMAGMALGSWLALRSRTVRRMRSLACLQALGAAAPAALYGVFAGAAHVSSPAGLFVAGQFVFPALAGVSGLLGGYEFPLACRVYSGQSTTPPPLYALDLAGSCAGAYLFSAYLIPVFGFLKTALLMAIVGLGPAAMAMTQTSKPDPAG